MTNIEKDIASVLAESGFANRSLEGLNQAILAFESETVLGFVFVYRTPTDLISRWNTDAERAVRACQPGLRRAELKAWNTYAIFLAEAAADFAERVHLSAIEENLTGTRKIARAGVSDRAGVRRVMLPLLPIQAAPRLDAVDIVAEIRLRTTELSPRAVEAFLSEASEVLVAQVLEEAT
jgi:hypothetical protein